MIGFKSIKLFIFNFLRFFYFLMIVIRNFFYDIKLIKIKKFNKPVIGVGNITTGGTGKTPMVIEIAKILIKLNKKPIIISRGYKRQSKGTVIVSDNNNILESVVNSGDEPFLIAKKLKNIPIIVDKNRYKAAQIASQKFDFDIVILDDSFQHRKIFKDLNLVMINFQEKDENYSLLPVGRLREPYSSLKRADLIIWSKYKKDYETSSFNKKIIETSREQLFTTIGLKNQFDKKFNILVFCAVGDPQSFIGLLHSKRLNIVHKIIFKDHEKLSMRKLNELIELKNKYKADYIVTTEKDWVKLPESFQKSKIFKFLELEIKFKNNDKDLLISKIKKLI
ncbi:MAG: tetraacyldisaccharide 4'-kinase [Candidatus Marinimicrobia bacterium]|nr:tetraacyldisaccharide 4'-kinase [Candidatus Neomarinimicrobiota bacterium]OUW50839.1 MAG: tetraacyldisaccharide 4'-kinase [bacterium TMED190]|tara:strand:- start:2107 stop:3114 length:1008 start_codon:yes stop_codon:yes gene_type:complete